ncbi:MAG: hypothetical protein JRE58_13615 [Deltaproteobacteria bacterium]|nr:hypothetical protein [Deltaproteobacteria bacterium]
MVKTGFSRIVPDDLSGMTIKELQELICSDLSGLDFRTIGNIILGRVLELSRAVNTELMEPISRWLDDPHFMDKFRVGNDGKKPDWAEYKRQQRSWTRQQKVLAAERLKLYWQKIRKRRKLRKELASLRYTDTQKRKTIKPYLNKTVCLKGNFLFPIISPFSPVEQNRFETLQEFKRALFLNVSDLLPWRLLLAGEIKKTTQLSGLRSRYREDKKKDVVSKLMHLLQMQADGNVLLRQDKPFADIIIEPVEMEGNTLITVKDRQGRSYGFDWQMLSEAQQDKIVADIKANKIIYKTNPENGPQNKPVH